MAPLRTSASLPRVEHWLGCSFPAVGSAAAGCWVVGLSCTIHWKIKFRTYSVAVDGSMLVLSIVSAVIQFTSSNTSMLHYRHWRGRYIFSQIIVWDGQRSEEEQNWCRSLLKCWHRYKNATGGPSIMGIYASCNLVVLVGVCSNHLAPGISGKWPIT